MRICATNLLFWVGVEKEKKMVNSSYDENKLYIKTRFAFISKWLILTGSCNSVSILFFCGYGLL